MLQATELDPKYAKGWGRLAKAYECAMNLPDSIEAYRTAAQLGAANKKAYEREMQAVIGKVERMEPQYLCASHSLPCIPHISKFNLLYIEIGH